MLQYVSKAQNSKLGPSFWQQAEKKKITEHTASSMESRYKNILAHKSNYEKNIITQVFYLLTEFNIYRKKIYYFLYF